MITEQEFKEWLEHPVTRTVRELLGKKREELRQAWEGGSFTDYDERTTVLVNVGNLGTCKGYAFVQELDYQQYVSEMELEDGKPVGPAAPRSSSAD